MRTVTIRELVAEDCQRISEAFAQQGWHRPVTQYTRYLEEQRAGDRSVLAGYRDTYFVGYVTIVWQSGYPPFAAQEIPEIVDFNVLVRYRRQGIGAASMDYAEQRIVNRSPLAGIGVCLTPDYGPAHILYVKRGYIPDGRGLMQDGRFLTHGTHAVVDDSLILHLTKQLAY